MLILAFLALTTIAAFVAYLAGYGAGQREQTRQTLLDIEVLRRAEDDRAYADLMSHNEFDPGVAEALDEWLAWGS